MEDLKLHNRTHWLYTHFFHFFDIPHFLPYELIKKFLKKWNKYFNSRDALEEAIEDKDACMEASNIDGVLDEIGNLTAEYEHTQLTIDAIIADYKTDKNTLDGIVTNFEDMLNDIINWQNSYKWKTT